MPMWWISNLTPWTFSYYLLCLHSATSSRCQVNFSNFDLFIQNYANFHTVKLIYSTTKSTICVLIIMYLCTIYLDVNTSRERTRSPELKPRLAGGWYWFAVRKKYFWLVASGWCWFDVREKYYCWLPTEQSGPYLETGTKGSLDLRPLTWHIASYHFIYTAHVILISMIFLN